ncbi:hypothetical protein KCP77_09455 [Salmonella enterica subsp. enterica]|nr:hypothetical protein KCP77_09455 [Salmonella enterica subsp. enterica]
MRWKKEQLVDRQYDAVRQIGRRLIDLPEVFKRVHPVIQPRRPASTLTEGDVTGTALKRPLSHGAGFPAAPVTFLGRRSAAPALRRPSVNPEDHQRYNTIIPSTDVERILAIGTSWAAFFEPQKTIVISSVLLKPHLGRR